MRCKTRRASEPRGHSEHWAMHCSAPGFQGKPFRPAGLPTDSARTAGGVGNFEGAAVLRASRISLLPAARAADCAARPAVGRLSLVTPLGGGRPPAASEPAYRYRELGCRTLQAGHQRPGCRVRRSQVPSRFGIPHLIQAEVQKLPHCNRSDLQTQRRITCIN